MHCCSLQIYCPAWTKTGVRCSLWFAAILYSGLTQDPSVPRNTSTVSIVGLQQVMSRSPFIRPLWSAINFIARITMVLVKGPVTHLYGVAP